MKTLFDNMIPDIGSLRDIGTSKRLAKFGDIVVNMAYSLALTVKTKRIDAAKVSKKILSNALKQADMKKYAKSRANSHDMANTAEAFVGYMYIKERWSAEKIAKVLIKVLQKYDFSSYKEEIDGSIVAFKSLLRIIKKEITAKLDMKPESMKPNEEMGDREKRDGEDNS